MCIIYGWQTSNAVRYISAIILISESLMIRHGIFFTCCIVLISLPQFYAQYQIKFRLFSPIISLWWLVLLPVVPQVLIAVNIYTHA